jgi:hypothetical protein
MRITYLVLILGALAACSPSVPDSGAGAGGFDNSPEAQRARDAALANGGTITGDPLIPPAAVSSETLGPAPVAVAAPLVSDPGALAASPQLPASPAASGGGDDIARETAAALALVSANSGVAPVQASPSNPAPQTYGSPGLSDENDFSAVSGRESIESDAERLAGYRQDYEQVQPTAVPQRPGAGGPNIVAYAVETSNPVGARVYSRTGFNLEAKASRNCGKYPSPDQAQIDFLATGGPQRDRKGLDPDGDGFACGWDPTPFRQAAQN